MAIDIKPSHKGLLHRALGLKQGEKIPAAALQKAKNSPDPAMRKRATFAANAKKWRKPKKAGEKSAGHASKLYGAK